MIAGSYDVKQFQKSILLFFKYYLLNTIAYGISICMRDSPHDSHSQRPWSINALQYCDVSVRCWDEAATQQAVHSSDEMRTITSINDGHVTLVLRICDGDGGTPTVTFRRVD
jgi:hypothetical protein